MGCLNSKKTRGGRAMCVSEFRVQCIIQLESSVMWLWNMLRYLPYLRYKILGGDEVTYLTQFQWSRPELVHAGTSLV